MHKQLKPLIIFQGVSNLDENWWVENQLPIKLAFYTKVYCFEYPQFNKLWKLIFYRKPIVEKKSNNLIIFHSLGFFPLGRKIKLFNTLNHFFNFFFFKRLINSNFRNFYIISFTPEISILIDKIKTSRLFYYITDDYSSLPWWNNHRGLKQLENLEKTLIPYVKKIIVVSDNLKRKYKSFRKPISIFRTPVEISQYNKKLKNNYSLSYSHPIIGFSGSIYDWKVDINLIINLLKELPNCSFVFTGTVKIKNKLLNRKLFSFLNFHHLGILPINKLQQVMSQFDVCLIPYKINKWSQSAYPVKIMEYLALGKPVVVTNLSSIDYLAKNKIIYRASNELSFINLIKKALNEKFNKNTYKNRIDEAIKNDWKNRIIELINMIENDK